MKKISVYLNDKTYNFDAENPLSLAIPLDFAGLQPNAYGVERASAKACQAGDLVGDTRRGGSCNFEQIKFIPHCNGTHTECVGHLTRERISVHDCLQDVFILAMLISVTPENAEDTGETYAVELKAGDKLITKKSLENILRNFETENTPLAVRHPQSLIIRTLPNDENKLSQTYLEKIPPFFSTEAMNFIAELNVNHLLIDTPSIDRIFDDGKLSNHRIFWNVEPESREITKQSLIHKTITELIYAPAEIKDGAYLLNLQIAPFVADAAPSRPVLFKIQPLV